MKKNFSFVGVIQTGTAFTLVFSLISLFDHYHRYLELLSHFKFQYLLILSASSIIFMLLKQHKFAAICAAGTVLNAFFVVPWYFSNNEAVVENLENELTILHSNVLSSNERFDDFIALIHEENPDLFVMQEVNGRWLSEMQVLKKTYPHHLAIPRQDNFGIALFSKYPLNSVEQTNWGSWQLPSIIAQFSLDEQNITVIATHPLPPVGQEYYQARNDQLSEVVKYSQQINGPLILIGDLNVTMFSHDYSSLIDDTNLRNTRAGFGLLPSWPTQLFPFMIPIDHCLISPHFIVKDMKTGHNIGSDHLPVVVHLGLKIPEPQ